MAGLAAQARPRFAGLRFLGLVAALAPGPAVAGAWIAPKGGQEVWTSVAGERGGVSFYESSGYLEAPVGEETSVLIAPWLEQNYDTVDGWRGEATLSVKHAIYRDGRAIMALQGGGLWVSHPPAECGEGGAEVRWLGGASFGRSGFVNLEAAGRLLEGGCESTRLDLTAGYRPSENWLGLAQVFLDAPSDGEGALRAQLTFVRFGENGRGVQVGVRARIDGENQEPAIVLAFWGRPGD